MSAKASNVPDDTKVLDAVEQGTTMRLYDGIVNYGELHRLAFIKLSRAVASGDTAAMKEAFDAIVYYEEMGRQAAIETRKHLLEKAMDHEQS